MTYKQAYLRAKELLAAAGIQSAGFDAICLMERQFGFNRAALSSKGDCSADPDALKPFFELANARAGGEPLQYLLQEWNLCGYTFKVGDGVLIPRQETEILVYRAVELIKDISNPVIYDLCAGSGCIAICLSKLRPDAIVYAVEISDMAFWFLAENIRGHEAENVHAIKGDVCRGHAGIQAENCDLLVSNPPYIPKNDLKNLSREVLREPQIALDGGVDGLTFYRAIAKAWLPAVKSGRSIAVEVGAGQAAEVAGIFAGAHLQNIERFKDFSGIERVVTARVSDG